MNGAWVLVCGPSGAGKDSVLAWSAEALAAHTGICFARRLVTRPGPHDDAVRPRDIAALRDNGQLAWHWRANGHCYGVRAEYQARVRDGEVVVVNGSREHARQVAGETGVRCVLVTAGAQLLLARLLARGREDRDAVVKRMERNGRFEKLAADRVIVNEGALAEAGARLRDYLLELAR